MGFWPLFLVVFLSIYTLAQLYWIGCDSLRQGDKGHVIFRIVYAALAASWAIMIILGRAWPG